MVSLLFFFFSFALLYIFVSLREWVELLGRSLFADVLRQGRYLGLLSVCPPWVAGAVGGGNPLRWKYGWTCLRLSIYLTFL
ncbi:hypothetical protein F5Y13DRAFT_151777 [Hypoxylon sp. FL1857]|nr:hypothetical protein F5Y13DRAFT_151777 [Hypoxylon sp. FL1857]